jgi:hypothetical protein
VSLLKVPYTDLWYETRVLVLIYEPTSVYLGDISRAFRLGDSWDNVVPTEVVGNLDKTSTHHDHNSQEVEPIVDFVHGSGTVSILLPVPIGEELFLLLFKRLIHRNMNRNC